MPRPSCTTVVRHGRSWHDAVAAGVTEGAEWLLLLEDGVEPAPDALDRLLAALEDLGEAPAPDLLVAKVLAPDGTLHPAAEPWIPLLDRIVTIAAAKRGLASVRLARWGALLVRRDAVERHGPPRADFTGGADDLEWTARILQHGHGYVVPQATAIDRRPTRSRIGPREVRDRVRMLREPIWTAQEPVWFAFELLVALAGGGRARSRTPTAPA